MTHTTENSKEVLREVLYTEYWDLDRAKKNGKYYIDRDNTVTENATGKKYAFPSQVSAIEWIKKQAAIEAHNKPKEVLHTQGEWIVDERQGKICIECIGEQDGESYAVNIAHLHGNTPIDKADAELICKAVNERQKLIDERDTNQRLYDAAHTRELNLLDSNRELLEALELAKEIMDTYKISNSKAGVRMIAAINNAKNI